MAEHTVRQEEEAVSLSERPLQRAKQGGKTTCWKCFQDASVTNFFSKGAGMIQHFRTVHRNIDVDEVRCKTLFQQLHGKETADAIARLSRFRLETLCTVGSYSEYNVSVEEQGVFGAKIVAKTRREAAKLYGLILHHCGKLRALGDRPCVVQVEEVGNSTSRQSFRTWFAGDKIYVECFIPGRRTLAITQGDTSLFAQNSVFTGEYTVGSKSPLEVLQTVFGHTNFRPGQWNVISKILSGKDVIVVIPTGGGKTVVYTLPCIMAPGLAIIISPILMLMCDQVARLRGYGINTCYYNTLLSDDDRKNILHNLKQPDCQYQFVFISPEAVITDSFQSCLDALRCENSLKMFVVDEAHCIDTWGKDFRPAYQQLGILRKYGLPFVALTGTATKQTLSIISTALQLENPEEVRLPCRRNNLCFSVIAKKELKAKDQVAQIVSGDFDGLCGIVYCARQADTVEMAFELKEKGIPATYYHAGMEGGERIRNANMWLEDKIKVMCCTNAFGMGIDKKGVRFVIHLTLPSSLEDYVQESGRGGRDGDNCSCILLFRFADRSFHLRNVAAMSFSEDSLTLLNSLTDFCMQTSLCRQQFSARYFDENLGEACNCCDICQEDSFQEQKDLTLHVRNVIDCLRQISALEGKPKLTDLAMTYMGSKAKPIITQRFNTVAQYGKGKDQFLNVNNATKFIQFLIFKGFIKENIRSLEERMTINYLTCGNVVDLVDGRCQVFFNL